MHALGLPIPLNCPLQMNSPWGDAFFVFIPLYSLPLRSLPSNKHPWQKSRQVNGTFIHFPTAAFIRARLCFHRVSGPCRAMSCRAAPAVAVPQRSGRGHAASPSGRGSAERPARCSPAARGTAPAAEDHEKQPWTRACSDTGKDGKDAFRLFGLSPHPDPPPGETGHSPLCAPRLRVWVRTRGFRQPRPCSPSICCCRGSSKHG